MSQAQDDADEYAEDEFEIENPDDEPRPNENSNNKSSKMKNKGAEPPGLQQQSSKITRGSEGEEYHLGSPSHAQQ